jgi:ribosomal protein S18 acetylase RimI-like enzyme
MTSMRTEEVALRPATEDDREFLLAVYAASRQEELDQVEWPPGQREWFLRMQFDLQDREHRRLHPHADFAVVEVGGRPAGRLYVDRGADALRIVDVALLPGFRGAGVGGRLITALLEEAAASGRTVTLHVAVHNRAVRLYERLGFVGAETEGVYRAMEWTP